MDYAATWRNRRFDHLYHHRRHATRYHGYRPSSGIFIAPFSVSFSASDDRPGAIFFSRVKAYLARNA